MLYNNNYKYGYIHYQPASYIHSNHLQFSSLICKSPTVQASQMLACKHTANMPSNIHVVVYEFQTTHRAWQFQLSSAALT